MEKAMIVGVFDIVSVQHTRQFLTLAERYGSVVVGILDDSTAVSIHKGVLLSTKVERISVCESFRGVEKAELFIAADRIQMALLTEEYNIYADASDTSVVEYLNEIGLQHSILSFGDLEQACLAYDNESGHGMIGYTTGVFDVFHPGHLNIIKCAKEMCDYLIVGVSTDENVQQYKGITPVVPFEQRMEIVRSLKYVDRVVPQSNMDKFEAWKRLQFHLLFHGNDWKGTTMYDAVEKHLNDVGVKTVYFEYTKGVSSTQIRNRLNNSRK